MKRNHDIIEIAVDLRHETDRAYLVSDGVRDVWLPFQWLFIFSICARVWGVWL